MNQLINLMLKIPVEILAGSAQLIAKAIEDFQHAFNETANQLVAPNSMGKPVSEETGSTLEETSSILPLNIIDDGSCDGTCDYLSQNPEENETMYDDASSDPKDLSGDELKYVSYSIIFTKRDFEATLVGEREEIVDYDTDSGAFGALKISEYFDDIRDGAEIPREWRDGSRGRPGPDRDYGFANGRYSKIPGEDRKYIRFVYTVHKRMRKSAMEYDRDSRDSQRTIADNIGRIADSI